MNPAGEFAQVSSIKSGGLFDIPEPKINLGQLLKVIGLPTERARAGAILGQVADLIREIVSVVDGLITTSIAQRTATDFLRTRDEIFPQYVAAITALGSLARIVLPKQTIERLSFESFSEMEANFRDLGEEAFGADLSEHGLFTVWTLRKIYDLAQEIEATPSETTQADSEKAREFVRCALWNRFHLDLLIKAMRSGSLIFPEVKGHVKDGLRAAVYTYAHIRDWADLRRPIADQEIGNVEWTDDDEVLLVDSMRDLDKSLL